MWKTADHDGSVAQRPVGRGLALAVAGGVPASNDGQPTHALAISGPGVARTTTSSPLPGQKANLTVTLQSGKYDFFRPVGNHQQMGMDMNVSVAAGGGDGAATTTSGAAGGGGGDNGY
jgi:hypothetical protein